MYTGHLSTVSNREDWTETVSLTDEDTGELLDISHCRITMTVIKFRRSVNVYRDGYYGGGFFYGYDHDGPLLTGSTDTGEIVIVSLGTFSWLFPQTRMNCLPQGEYQVGMRVSQDGRTMQLATSVISVYEGIDNQ